MLAIETRLANVLAGEAATAQEQLELADMCLRTKQRNADAALLYSKAFSAAPNLAQEPGGHRYNAACAAALAGCGQGIGAGALESSAKARLRGQAFDWLQAELAAYGDLPAGNSAVAARVHEQLRHWLDDPGLGGVRDEPEMAALPDAERQRWTELWGTVRQLTSREARTK